MRWCWRPPTGTPARFPSPRGCRRSVAAIRAHAFYGCLVNTEWGKPCDPAQVRSARRDARRMRVGWAIVWKRTPFVYAYLRQVGFRYGYGVNGVSVYRLDSQPH